MADEKSVFCLVDASLKDFVGHHYEYDRAVCEGATSEGFAVVCLAHHGVTHAIETMLPVRRAFKYDIWNGPLDRSVGKDAFEAASNDAFYEELTAATADLRLDERSIVFGHMVTSAQLLGWARFAQDNAKPGGPTILLLLRYQPEHYFGVAAKRAFEILEELAPLGRLRLASDSGRLSHQLERLTILPIEVWPIPHTTELTDIKPLPYNGERPLRVVSLGNARDEKGILELFNAVRIINAVGHGHRVSFVFQVNDPAPDIRPAISYFADEAPCNVTLLHEPLSSDEYFDLLKSADIVALPYWKEIYAARTSGVFLEAVAAGKPIACTNDTWMSDQLSLAGAGTVIENRDDNALATALIDIVDDFAALSRLAQDTSAEWLKIHNPSSFMRSLLHGEQAASPASSRPTAAILYPWGDAIQNAAGAALRVNLLARFLAERCDHVRLLGEGAEPELTRGRITFESFPINNLIGQTRAFNLITWFARQILRARNGEEIYFLYLLLPRFSRSFYARIHEIVKNSDLIFLEYPFWAPLVARACAANDKTFVLTNYDVICDQVRHSRPLRWLTALVERRSLRLAANCVSVTAGDQAKFARWGVKSRVSLNSVDAEALAQRLPIDTRSVLLRLCSLPPETGPIFLFVGSKFGPNVKAAEIVRTIAADLQRHRPDLNSQVVVAGACMLPIREAGFSALGRIDQIVLKLLYEHCQAVLVPLTEGTGLSLKTVEALAGGHVVVGTDKAFRGLPVPDEPSWIQEQNLGDYVHHLVRLAEDPALTESLSEAARRYGEQVDFRAAFSCYLELFPVLAESQPERLHPEDQYRDYVVGALRAARKVGDDKLALSLADSLLAQYPTDGPTAFEAAILIRHDDREKALDFLDTAFRGGVDAVAVIRERARLAEPFEASALMASAARIAFGRSWSPLSELTLRSALWAEFHAGEREWVNRVATLIDDSRPTYPACDYTYLRVHTASELNGEVSAELLQRSAAALDKGFDVYWGSMLQAQLLRRSGRDEDAVAAYARAARANGAPDLVDAAEREAVLPLLSRFEARDFKFVLNRGREILATWPENAIANFLVAESMRYLGRDLLLASRHYAVASRNERIAWKAHIANAELLRWIGEQGAAQIEIDNAFRRAHDDAERAAITNVLSNPSLVSL